MNYKKLFVPVIAIIGISIFSVQTTNTAYALNNKNDRVGEYENYIQNLKKVAEMTNLIDFSWLDIERVNHDAFQNICKSIQNIAANSENKLKIILNPYDIKGVKLENRKKGNFKLLNELIKKAKNLDVPNKEGLSSDIVGKSGRLIEKLKMAFCSAKKSGVLNLCNIGDELCEETENILIACIARLKTQQVNVKKLILIYPQMINQSRYNRWLEVAHSLEYDTHSTKDVDLILRIEAAINMGYETHTIDLLNLCKEEEDAHKSELYMILGGIREFAEKYDFEKYDFESKKVESKKVNILLGNTFDKFYKDIKDLCDKYKEKFNIIKESKYLPKSGILDYTNTEGMQEYFKQICEKHNSPVQYMSYLAIRAKILDATAYFTNNYLDVEEAATKKTLDEIFAKIKAQICIDYSPAISSNGTTFAKCFSVPPSIKKSGSRITTTLVYKQALLKKLNTAYYVNQVVLNSQQRIVDGEKVWYEPNISVAGLLTQRALFGKPVKNFKIYTNFSDSVADKKAKAMFESLKIEVKSFDTDIYNRVMYIIENAKITGVLDFVDEKFNDIEKSGNFDMVTCCIANFLWDNQSRNIKLIVDKKTKNSIIEKLNMLEKAYNKLSVVKV